MRTNTNGIRKLSENFDRVQGLMSYVNEATLLKEHRRQSRKKATGIDGVNKDDYDDNVEENVHNLVCKMKTFSYKPQPVRRTYILKANGKLRPLGIPAYEDKLVQGVMAEILNEVYEPRFLDVSYGFRPNRSAHDAVAKINEAVMSGNFSWVLEADIKGFFDNVNHEKLVMMLENDIDDERFLRYIKRFLKAGIMENGEYADCDRGTPQGGLVSPVLANVYLHNVLDQWFCRDIMPRLRGKAQYVRYADDFLILFQYEYDAKRVMEVLGKRLGKYSLELAEDKTRIARIGKDAEKEDQFDFLGFTFYKARTRSGKYRLGIKTSEKKLKMKRQSIKKWAKERINKPVHETIKKVAIALRGHFNYYGVNGNLKALQKFKYYVAGCLKRVLCRRSQKGYVTWEKFHRMWNMNTPEPSITKDIWHWEPKTG